MGAASDLGVLLKLYWSLLVGNIVEWYEYAVFGYLEPYLEDHFFRGSAVATWLGFAVTFAARPLGGVVLGAVGDTVGRKAAVNFSIVGMLVGTCGQGLLPTYASGSNTLGIIGVLLLIFCRFLQGVSAAGEISTISTYITEVGPLRSLGRSISLIAITGNMGFLSAKAVIFALQSVVGEESMASWGWRVPFVLALIPGMIAVWGRRWLPESEAFLKQQEEDEADDAEADGEEYGPSMVAVGSIRKVTTVTSSHGRSVLIGVGAAAAFATLQYGGFVWIQSFLKKQGMSASDRMVAGLCARGLMIILAVPVGWLTDVKGVGWVTLVGASALALTGAPLFAVLANNPTDLLTVVLTLGIGLALLGGLSGTVFFYFVAELFPTSVRGVATGIAYNVGFSLFGGLSPVLAQASLSLTLYGPGILLSVAGLITVCSVLGGLLLQRRGLLQLTHVRRWPYCECGAERFKEIDDDTSSEDESTSIVE